MLEWGKLLNATRRKSLARGSKKVRADADRDEVRTEFERDYDRILFSTPVRRLGDKTQVFPLDPHDSIRTRLTHSLEVSNLARSIGIHIAFNTTIVPKHLAPQRNVSALLGAIGLAHDLGNPPFGHQGEETIRSWFRNKHASKTPIFADRYRLTDAMKQDFLQFDGNAQTFRLVTRLQILNDAFGLNLTYGTLAALLKYSVPTNKVEDDPNNASIKKHGFFQSEKQIVDDVWKETGLKEGLRHPLTYIMEACDDIAYSVLDAEDAVKKGLVSFTDVIEYLLHDSGGDSAIANVVTKAQEDHEKHRKAKLSPSELNDVSMQMFRVHAIGAMVKGLTGCFENNIENILKGKYRRELIASSSAAKLRDLLKAFNLRHAFRHRSVLKVELEGHNVLVGLMDMLWTAIVDRDDERKVGANRKTPFTRYAYSRISESYRRIFEADSKLPIRYREAQLLTDMMSGMTDTYAMTLHNELKAFHVQ